MPWKQANIVSLLMVVVLVVWSSTRPRRRLQLQDLLLLHDVQGGANVKGKRMMPFDAASCRCLQDAFPLLPHMPPLISTLTFCWRVFLAGGQFPFSSSFVPNHDGGHRRSVYGNFSGPKKFDSSLDT